MQDLLSVQKKLLEERLVAHPFWCLAQAILVLNVQRYQDKGSNEDKADVQRSVDL